MDIGLLVAQPKSNQPAQTAVTKTSVEYGTSFDQAFTEAVQTPVEKQQATPATTDVEQLVEEVTEVIATDDLKTLFDLLGIELDDSLNFAQIDGQIIPVDQLMNLEDLTAALGMIPGELQEMIGQLLGEDVPVQDVWSVLEQAPALLAQITAVLQGESTNVTPKEAAKVVEFLKLAQVVGLKTDTVYHQEFQLKETKQALQAMLPQLAEASKQPAEAPKAFQQVLQTVAQVEQKIVQVQQTSQVQQVTQQTEPTQTAPVVQQPQLPTKTVTVVLPANPAAQSEALVKELEQAISRSQLSNSQGQIKLLLKLYPENLGQIRVELFQKDGVMQARLLASTGQAKDLLDASINQLKTALTNQNIQVDRIDIAQSLQSTDQQLRDQNFFNNFFRQEQQEQEEQATDDEEQVSFEEFLQEQFSTEEV